MTWGRVHPLIERLAEERKLRCPLCVGGPLVPGQGQVRCEACSQTFAIYNRVVDLFGLGVPDGVAAPDRTVALAERLTAALDLPTDEASVGAVADVLGRTALLSANDALDAEIRDIADRFGLEVAAGPDLPVAVAPAGDVLDVVVDRHYVPAALAAGEQVTCNVRFSNRGSHPLGSESDPPVTVGVRWLDAEGVVLPMAERRTRLPIVVAAGRSITLPVVVDVPATQGPHTLVVCPVIEGRRWVAEGGVAVAVEVGTVAPPLTALDLQLDATPPDYGKDHETALAMLREQVADILARPGRRILEIGGGTSPQISWFGPHEAVNVDISLPLLELGSLWYAHHAAGHVAENLAFLCADATSLPFEDCTFDVVTMFATLHHFAAPEALLAECRRVLADDGVVAVLCEPVGSTLEASVTIRDLEKGINEQVFTVAEYDRIFAAAGLEPVGGNVIGSSLRAFLRPVEPDGARFDAVAPVPALIGVRGGRPEPSPPGRLERAEALARRGLGLTRRVRAKLAALWD